MNPSERYVDPARVRVSADQYMVTGIVPAIRETLDGLIFADEQRGPRHILSDDECFEARRAQGNLGAHAPGCHGGLDNSITTVTDEPFDGIGTSPAPRVLDTWSSASRQHHIDTGEYLSVGEAIEADDHERKDRAMRYHIRGTTSTGETFDLPGEHMSFDSHDDAVTYAMEYAKSVSGTDEVEIERLPTVTVVTARGAEYAEQLRIDLQGERIDAAGAITSDGSIPSPETPDGWGIYWV
jgi:hypothetical protein